MVLSLFRITAHFLKLSKAFLCCVHSATRHDQLFSVSFNSEPISKACPCCMHSARRHDQLFFVFSNHNPFLKLFKICPCCVGSTSRRGQLFRVSLKSQAFPKFVLVVYMLLPDITSGVLSLSQITAHLSIIPRFVLCCVHGASMARPVVFILL